MRKGSFKGSLTGSESEVHRFDQATEVIWVEATSSYVCLCLKNEKGRIFYSKKKDATVKPIKLQIILFMGFSVVTITLSLSRLVVEVTIYTGVMN